MRRSFPLSGFCSYSHKDDKLRERLDTFLQSLRREGLVNIWNDRRIGPGDEWVTAIDDRLLTADIILLLVTANFVASDYCMQIELSRAMDRHERGEAIVVPIILRDSVWQNQQFAKLQALPRDGRPVMRHPRGSDYALREVVEGIRNIIRDDCPEVSNPQLPDPRDTVLAYLCNRMEQEIQLRAAWEEHMSKKRRRPFVCIVHGGVEEDHPGYRKRLLAYSLPRTLGMPKGTEITRHVLLKWPADVQGHDAILKSLSSNLASALRVPSDNSTMMNLLLSSIGNPAVVCCDLMSSSRNYGQRESLDAFLDFWSSWPDLSFAQAVVIVLSVNYQPASPRISTQHLSATGVAHPNLSVVILQELPAISNSDVREWMRHPEVMKFCDVESNASGWQADIDYTFLNRDHIPMEQLAGSLNRMLAEYQRRSIT